MLNTRNPSYPYLPWTLVSRTKSGDGTRYAQVLDGYIYDGVVPEDGVLVELTVVA